MRGGGIHYPANKFSNSPFLFSLHLARRIGARDKQKAKKKEQGGLSPLSAFFSSILVLPFEPRDHQKNLQARLFWGTNFAPVSCANLKLPIKKR